MQEYESRYHLGRNHSETLFRVIRKKSNLIYLNLNANTYYAKRVQSKSEFKQ